MARYHLPHRDRAVAVRIGEGGDGFPSPVFNHCTAYAQLLLDFSLRETGHEGVSRGMRADADAGLRHPFQFAPAHETEPGHWRTSWLRGPIVGRAAITRNHENCSRKAVLLKEGQHVLEEILEPVVKRQSHRGRRALDFGQ